MKILDFISSHGDGNVMEDIGGWKGNFVWVLDGATGIQKNQYFDQGSDAYWLVNIVHSFIKSNSDKYESPQELLRKASDVVKIEASKNSLRKSIQDFELPSYAISCAEVGRDYIKYLVLGDCSIVIKTAKGIKVISDDNFKHNTMDNRIMMPEDGRLRKMLVKTRRSTMNKIGGYAIGSIDGKAYNINIEEKFDLTEKSDIIFCSDGFSRIVNKYNLLSWKKIFDCKLSDVLGIIRSYESSIAVDNGKRSDDIFAIKVCNYD